jgi:hypothetical protein
MFHHETKFVAHDSTCDSVSERFQSIASPQSCRTGASEQYLWKGTALADCKRRQFTSLNVSSPGYLWRRAITKQHKKEFYDIE